MTSQKHDSNLPYGVSEQDDRYEKIPIERGIFTNSEIGTLEQSYDRHLTYPDNIIMSGLPNLERSQIYELEEIPVDFYHRRIEYDDDDARYTDEPVKNISQ